MTEVALGFCLNLIAFAAVEAAASLALLPVLGRGAAGRRRSSRWLAAHRLLPTLLAVAVVGLWVLPGFLWFEPQATGERVTPAIAALALASAALLASGLVRGVRGLIATHRLVRRWRAGARPMRHPGLAVPATAVDDPYPVVAVAGILRPRLYVARRVLGALTTDEMAAVFEHEAAHLRRRDNLARLVLRSCPDLPGWCGAGAALERAFEAATERESDAAVGGTARRLDLASALVKVARLAQGRSFAPGAASAFYAGDPIADRVRRLLDPPPAGGRPGPRRRIGVTVALAAAILLFADVQPTLVRDVHGVTERFVRLLQ